MAYSDRVQGEIKKEELRNLWQKVCEAYMHGGIEQIKSILISRIDDIKRNYQEQLENLNKMI